MASNESRFAFGKNWASYASLVDEARIGEAVRGLRRLAGEDLRGKRFLDLGCGSGLHALAALRLGAAEVVAVDIDRDSVNTARAVLEAHGNSGRWRVIEGSALEIEGLGSSKFDIVYSWGVLHHTGDMHGALRNAANLLASGGLLVFSLYRKTRLCWLWKIEKRVYARANPRLQRLIRGAYVGLFRSSFAVSSNSSFRDFLDQYGKANRGMDFYHDVHDWLGGWPYESISPDEVETVMTRFGLVRVRAFAFKGMPLGLWGSGCDEYAYARPPATWS